MGAARGTNNRIWRHLRLAQTTYPFVLVDLKLHDYPLLLFIDRLSTLLARTCFGYKSHCTNNRYVWKNQSRLTPTLNW